MQYEVREGREAREAGVVGSCRYRNSQSKMHFAGGSEWLIGLFGEVV